METKNLALVALSFSFIFLLSNSAFGDDYFYIYSGSQQYLPGEDIVLNICGSPGTIQLKAYKLDQDTLVAIFENSDLSRISVGDPITEWSMKISSESWCADSKIPLQKIQSGVYLVKGMRGKENSTSIVLVSKLAVMTKRTNERFVTFALDYSTGAPVEGVTLRLYNSDNNGLLLLKSTDSSGVLDTTISGDIQNINLLASKGDDVAIMSPYFYSFGNSKTKGYVYTDRPIYRPTHTVYFRAVGWNVKENGEYEIPAGEVTVEIKDPKDNTVYNQTLTINEFGSVSGSLTLGDEPPLGDYYIYVYRKDSSDSVGYATFSVEEYKKPEYRVVLQSDKESYVKGDRAHVDINVAYFFGEPVKDADVEYSVYAVQYYWPCYGYRCWYYEASMSRYYYGGALIDSGTLKTDEYGNAKVEINTNNISSKDYGYSFDTDASFRVEATVTDKSRRQETGSTSFVVYSSEFKFEITLDQYSYRAGQKVNIGIESNDIQDVPVSEFGKLKITKQTYEEQKGGYTETTVLERDIETDSNGKTTVEFVPDEKGSYNVEITGKDSRGNNVSASGYFYVWDEEPWYYTWDSLKLVLDKEEYKAGDTANLLINSPVRDFYAFVTIESNGLHRYNSYYFKGTSGNVQIPVLDEYKPNVVVDVLVVKEKMNYQTTADLVVPPVDKLLTVSIEPNSDTYKPRDTASFTIKTTDENGNPVATELSLGVVDESIYAIVEEKAAEIGNFFYGKRWSEVRTDYSWYGYGGARGAVEEAATGATNAQDMMGAPPMAAPIMASKSAEGGLVQPTVRSYFPDTAFWLPSIKTDSSGVARVSFDMPDSLTTWRATARAVSTNFDVGQNTDKVVVKKGLLVRLETPRFLTQNDELLISGVVHNYLGKTKEVYLELQAEGVQVFDNTPKQLTIEQNSDQRIDFRIKVDSCCSANFTIKALTDEESDAMEIALPIMPHGVEERVSWAGTVDNEVTKTINVPENTIMGASSLKILVSPSIAATAFDALDYLAHFPYGCVEQTMSAFLPDVMVSQVLKKLGIEKKEIQKDLPKMVSEGLQRLYNYQHSDGGWGWWENDETHPYMTAYVVYGMTQAKNAGYQVSPNVLARGVESLKTQLSTVDDANIKAYMLYALSFYEEADIPDLVVSDYGKALLALAAYNSGDMDKFRTLVNELKSTAKCTESDCHWEADTYKYGWNNNNVETTSYALMALIKSNAQDPTVQNAVRWLVNNRRGREWYSTKDTAIAVFALAEYMAVSDELNPNYVAKVYLNGDLEQQMQKTDAFDTNNEIDLTPPVGTNTLKITKEGIGKLYYAIVLRYYTEEEKIAAQSKSGLSVSRVYSGYNFNSGDEMNVTLKVKSDNDQQYMIIEDPMPAGFEFVQADEGYGRPIPYYYEDYVGYGSYGYNSIWYDRREIRDEKVVYFVTYLNKGENQLSYTLRAEVPGTYSAMPVKIYNMYDDTIFVHSAENEVSVAFGNLSLGQSWTQSTKPAGTSLPGMTVQPKEENKTLGYLMIAFSVVIIIAGVFILLKLLKKKPVKKSTDTKTKAKTETTKRKK